MTWKITKTELDNEQLLVNESLFAIGNGYLGVRGNFAEGYHDGYQSIRGTYINAFHDETEISYGEKLHAFPETQQKLVNVIDSQSIQVYLDDDCFSLFEGEVISFERNLHLDKGFSERIIHWRSPNGKEATLHFKRMISFVTRELFAMEVSIEPSDDVEQVKIISSVEGDVSNFVDPTDPRVASGHAKRLHVTDVDQRENLSIVENTTYVTNLSVACVTSTEINAKNYTYETNQTAHHVEEVYICDGHTPIRFTKYNVYTDTLRHGIEVIDKGIAIQQTLGGKDFDEFLKEQKAYLDDFWRISDIEIDGDDALQNGIRFNLYQLLQSAGKDSVSNIAAKGLSGEGYEGHYFWDTEIYMFPVFLMTHPEMAKNVLLYRYSLLDNARERAKEVGHQKGALFPWRTISGTECSPYYPAGTAQYHISADIAYSFIQYYLTTNDETFLKNYMAEVLFETARLWVDTGHMMDGTFRIDNVTGPDEYTCIVNNNYYTNVMAKYNLQWAVKVYHQLQANDPSHLDNLVGKIELIEAEVDEWKGAGENMYLPFDSTLKINAQDDTFLQKKQWDLENTPDDNFPLLLNYHPLTLYRYQVCKQADTVLGHFLLEDEAEHDTIQRSYDYYEKITTHDSSLSYCVFSIMASKLGYHDKAYHYFDTTARMDLDNTQGNTKDGLHMANMGGTWLAIIFGFAGVRVKEGGLFLAPSLPEKWRSLRFHLKYQGRLLCVTIKKGIVTYLLETGESLTIHHHGEPLILESAKVVDMPLD